MKVLVVGNGFTRTNGGGRAFANKHTADFLAMVSEAGHEVTFAQPVVESPSDAGLNNAEIAAAVRVLDLGKQISKLWAAVNLVRKADFVYLFFPGSWSRLLGRICRWLKKPFGLYVRGEQFSQSGADAKLLSGAAMLCVETGLDRRVSALNSRVITIAPMIDMSAFDQLRRPDTAERTGALRLLFVGRVEEPKGIPELMAAARALQARSIGFQLRIVGGGPLLPALADELKKPEPLPLELAGLVTEKTAMMENYEWADVLVLPSHHEGFPRVLFEAMIKSCAVVTTMVGGIPAVMKDRVNCLSVPVGAPAVLAERLEELATTPELLRKISTNGLDTVLQILATRPTHIASVMEVLNESV